MDVLMSLRTGMCKQRRSREWIDRRFGAKAPPTARAAQPHDPTAVGTDEHVAIEYAARKGHFAAMDINETASKHCCHPLCIIGLRNGIAGRSAASNEDSDGPDPIS
jgi:hypothetical protein